MNKKKKKENRDQKHTLPWLIVAGVLFASALVMRLGFHNYGLIPFILFGASAIILLDLVRENWALLAGYFTGCGLFLRFVLRGYAYWGYIAFGIAALVVAHRFFSKTLWRVLVVLLCLGIVYFCIVEIPIVKNSFTDDEPKRDYVIVLGAAVYGDEPSPTLVRRLSGALDYLEQYPDSVAIVSGGMGPGETIPEARAMHDWLVAHGVDEKRIIVEDQATSTGENLQFSFDLIRKRHRDPNGNVAVVSSAYHLYRAKYMARQLGVEAVGVAAPWGFPLVMLNYFIREAFGVTRLWLLGY